MVVWQVLWMSYSVLRNEICFEDKPDRFANKKFRSEPCQGRPRAASERVGALLLLRRRVLQELNEFPTLQLHCCSALERPPPL